MSYPTHKDVTYGEWCRVDMQKNEAPKWRKAHMWKCKEEGNTWN